MKIVEISPVFPPDENGTANVCYHNSIELSKKGFDVTVVVPDSKNRTEIEIEGVRVVRIPPFIRYGNASVIPSLLRISRREEGIIHLHLPFFGGAEWVAFGRILSSKNFVCTYHNDVKLANPMKYAVSAYHRIITERIFDRCQKWIVPSMAFAKQCQISKRILKNPDKLIEIPNGVDTERFSPTTLHSEVDIRSEEDEGVRILFIGVLDQAHHYKGLNILLKSMKILKGKHVYLTVIGDGELKTEYMKMADRFGLGENIYFAGHVRNDDMPAYYRSASCVVVPSTIPENMSLVVLEAMSCGRTVIVSRFPSTEYLIRDGYNGILFESGNEIDLAAKIESVLDNEELRTEIGYKGRELCVSRYSWDAVGDILADAIKQMDV